MMTDCPWSEILRSLAIFLLDCRISTNSVADHLMFLGVRAVRGRPDLGLSLILSFLWRVSEHWEQFVARFSTFFRFPFNSFLACQFSLALGLCLALGLTLDLVLALSLGLSVKNVPYQNQFRIISLCFDLFCILARKLCFLISSCHLLSQFICIYRILCRMFISFCFWHLFLSRIALLSYRVLWKGFWCNGCELCAGCCSISSLRLVFYNVPRWFTSF